MTVEAAVGQILESVGPEMRQVRADLERVLHAGGRDASDSLLALRILHLEQAVRFLASQLDARDRRDEAFPKTLSEIDD